MAGRRRTSTRIQSTDLPRGLDLKHNEKKSSSGTSVAIVAEAISCSKVRCVFPCVGSFSGFVLSKCLQPSFVVSHLFSMARIDDGSDVLVSLMPDTSSNHGSPYRSGPDLDGMGPRSFVAQLQEFREMLLPLARGIAGFDNQVKTLCEAVVALFAAMEQNVSALTENVSSLGARMCKIEANGTSVSCGSGSASSWDKVMAPQPLGSHGLESPDDNRNTRRRQ